MYNLPKGAPLFAKQKISEWVDKPTDEKFTALHFAAFAAQYHKFDAILHSVNQFDPVSIKDADYRHFGPF